MEVRNCKGCGRLFNYFRGPFLCPACVQDLEDKFQQVKEYIRENPKVSLDKVSEDNDVSVRQIQQWVREERLTFTEESQVTLDCEICGAKVLTGRFCNKCKTHMKSEFSQAIEGPRPVAVPKQTKQKDKMRFLDT